MRVVVVGLQQCMKAAQLAHLLGTRLVNFSVGRYADGEVWVTVDEHVAQQPCVVVFPLTTITSFNDQLFTLFFLLQRLREKNVKDISLLLSYMPYARQDQAFNSCEPLFSVVHKFLYQHGVTTCMAYDLHSQAAPAGSPLSIYSLPVHSFWQRVAVKIIDHKDNFCVAAPDEGGVSRAQKFAQQLGIELVMVKKCRYKADYVASCQVTGKVKDKNVFMIDDIVSTGRTVENACSALMSAGTKKVIGFFTHAVFASGAAQRIEQCGLEHLYVTDTLHTPQSKLPANATVVSLDMYNDDIVSIVCKKDYEFKAKTSSL